MTNREVNEAIYRVATAKYKKDDPVAFDLVERAGYEVSKYNGRWHISNPTTFKSVVYSRWGSFGSNGRVPFNNKINFVNYLETPYNRVWRDMQYSSWCKYEGKAIREYRKFKEARDRVKSLERRAATIRETMNQLVQEFMQLSDKRVEAKQDLNSIRHQLGLVK